MPVYLARHSRVAVSGLCYGQSEVPLAGSFAEEAAALKAQLAARFACAPKVLCSPSARCVTLADALGVDYQTDARLMELHFGAWEGRLWTEIDGPEARHWGEHWQVAAPPGGETLGQLMARVDACATEHASGGDLLLITHAGPIRALWHQRGGLTLEQAFARSVPHATLIAL